MALAVLGTVMRMRAPARIDLPYDLQSAALAAEFASTPEDLVAVFGSDHRYAKEIEQEQYIDFPFIACYVALFVILGWAFRHYDIPAAKAVSWTVIVLAVAAGVFDVAENISILRVAGSMGATVSPVRNFSLPKWGLVFAVMLLESGVFFFWPKLKLWWRLAAAAVGCLFLFTGAAGLLFTALVSVRDIEWTGGVMTWALVALLFYLAAAAAWLKPPRAIPLIKR